jgi:hypothetical protein
MCPTERTQQVASNNNSCQLYLGLGSHSTHTHARARTHTHAHTHTHTHTCACVQFVCVLPTSWDRSTQQQRAKRFCARSESITAPLFSSTAAFPACRRPSATAVSPATVSTGCSEPWELGAQRSASDAHGYLGSAARRVQSKRRLFQMM